MKVIEIFAQPNYCNEPNFLSYNYYQLGWRKKIKETMTFLYNVPSTHMVLALTSWNGFHNRAWLNLASGPEMKMLL